MNSNQSDYFDALTNSFVSSLWIRRIEGVLHLDFFIFLLALAIMSWFVAQIFLRHAAYERKLALKKMFSNLFGNILLSGVFFLLYAVFIRWSVFYAAYPRLIGYVGLGSIGFGVIVFIKIARIFLFEYLYVRHKKVSFPLLLVNLFTLLMSLVVIGWLASEVFGVKLTPLLATSALFTIVLGLALQDTLGNLFAGVSLQFDKPYQLGDWVEVCSDGDKRLVGQVADVTWRATLLRAFSEEMIIVPNRVIAQSRIFNFSTKSRPIIRALAFRITLDSDVMEAKSVILSAISSNAHIRQHPVPFVLVNDITESWILLKLVYNIDNFGDQYMIADKIYCQIIEKLNLNKIRLAPARMYIMHEANAHIRDAENMVVPV